VLQADPAALGVVVLLLADILQLTLYAVQALFQLLEALLCCCCIEVGQGPQAS
jgi:hypothetical protein